MAKNKSKNKVVAGLLVTAVAGGAIAGGVYAIQNAKAQPTEQNNSGTTQETQTETAQLQAQLQTLQSQKSQLETQLATANADKASLQTQLATVNAQIAQLQARLTALDQAYTIGDLVAEADFKDSNFKKIGNFSFVLVSLKDVNPNEREYGARLYRLNDDGYSLTEIDNVTVRDNLSNDIYKGIVYYSTESFPNLPYIIAGQSFFNGNGHDTSVFLINKQTGAVTNLFLEDINNVVFQYNSTNTVICSTDGQAKKIDHSTGAITTIAKPVNNLDIFELGETKVAFYTYDQNEEPDLTTLYVLDLVAGEWRTLHLEDAIDFDYLNMEYNEDQNLFIFETENDGTKYFKFDLENEDMVEVHLKTATVSLAVTGWNDEQFEINDFQTLSEMLPIETNDLTPTAVATEIATGIEIQLNIDEVVPSQYFSDDYEIRISSVQPDPYQFNVNVRVHVVGIDDESDDTFVAGANQQNLYAMTTLGDILQNVTIPQGFDIVRSIYIYNGDHEIDVFKNGNEFEAPNGEQGYELLGMCEYNEWGQTRPIGEFVPEPDRMEDLTLVISCSKYLNNVTTMLVYDTETAVSWGHWNSICSATDIQADGQTTFGDLMTDANYTITGVKIVNGYVGDGCFAETETPDQYQYSEETIESNFGELISVNDTDLVKDYIPMNEQYTAIFYLEPVAQQ